MSNSIITQHQKQIEFLQSNFFLFATDSSDSTDTAGDELDEYSGAEGEYWAFRFLDSSDSSDPPDGELGEYAGNPPEGEYCGVPSLNCGGAGL